MTSARRIAANRRNARKSTGPRTEVGKASARLNALRHGFAGATTPPARGKPEIERLANAIVGKDAPAAWHGQAFIIAETDLVLRKVRAAMAAEIEREPPVPAKLLRAARMSCALKIAMEICPPPAQPIKNWPDTYEWARGFEAMDRGKLGRIIRLLHRGARAIKAHLKSIRARS